MELGQAIVEAIEKIEELKVTGQYCVAGGVSLV